MRVPPVTSRLVGAAAVLLLGCGSGPPNAGEDEQFSTHNGVDCEVNPPEIEKARLREIPVLDPTARRISDKERKRHLNELSRFPDEMLAVFRRRHVSIKLTGGSIVEFEEFRSLRGQVPRGWEGTTFTWDDVPGTASPVGVFLGDSGRPNNAWSLALHEGTHAVDLALSFSAKNARLRDLYQAELGRPQAASDPNAWYRRSNIEEFFAVAMDELYCSSKTRERLHRLYPAMEGFLEHELANELAR